MLYVSASEAADQLKLTWLLPGVAVTLMGVGGAVTCGVAETSLDACPVARPGSPPVTW